MNRPPVSLPRPNPGPEALVESSDRWIWIAALAGLVVLALLVGWLRRRRRKAKGEPGPVPAEPVDSRRLDHAARLRIALVEIFGSGWDSLTTEEIAARPELAERIGVSAAERIIAFLRERDHRSFSGRSVPDNPESTAWVDQFLEFEGRATDKSMMTGR